MPDDFDDPRYGPWHPGLQSQIPRDLLPLATLFRGEHVQRSLAEIDELADLTGFKREELTVFRPERLALHEVLLRVTANISVPDGNRIEDLGINFRQIVQVLLDEHVAREMPGIVAAYDEACAALRACVARELAALYDPPAAPAPTRSGWWRRLTESREPTPTPDVAMTAEAHVSAWETRSRAGADDVERAACRALARTVSALLVRHGALWGDREVVARIAVGLAANALGSAVIGARIEPLVEAAVAHHGWRLLPRQAQPVVMNTKGPSAAGKSTMRLLQRNLAGRIGVDWAEFALISPDIWRKQLLDYASLGPAYKYAGAFTGEELSIVDAKLDRYMARKAERGQRSHLLIDRFRFDSFAPDSDVAGSNLLTRFGQIVYLFFLVTPPHLLVERAWGRGRDVGRYKAVDDTLAHAVEAYSGMPELFFTWIRRTEKRVHFEFLDNTVPRGAAPRTAAFGWNRTLHVLDVKCLIDIERYRKLAIDAQSAEALYPDRSVLDAARNSGFLQRCVAEFREVSFVEQATGRTYLHVVDGVPQWADRDILERIGATPDVRAGLLAAVPQAFTPAVPAQSGPTLPADETVHTVGQWWTTLRDAAPPG
ncbi:MAG: hypothetical protein U1F10_09385 [Burkholderiales bacterium]